MSARGKSRACSCQTAFSAVPGISLFSSTPKRCSMRSNLRKASSTFFNLALDLSALSDVTPAYRSLARTSESRSAPMDVTYPLSSSGVFWVSWAGRKASASEKTTVEKLSAVVQFEQNYFECSKYVRTGRCVNSAISFSKGWELLVFSSYHV